MTSPSSPGEQSAGRRVAHWRARRGLSQQLLADRLGKSKSWVDKIERGVRALDKFSVLQEIADVLAVDVDVLLGRAPQQRDSGRTGPGQAELDDLRAALERYVCLDRYLGEERRAPRLPELRKATEHAWLAFQHAGYDRLAHILPRLLQDAQVADAYHASGGDDAAREAAHLLGQCYQIASSVLRKLGAYELAWLSADRATAVAVRAGDPLLAGIAASRAGNALLALGRDRSALETQLTFANRLAPADGDAADPGRLSVYGQLLLQGAMAAARRGENATVRDLLEAAEEATVTLGADGNHYWTSFGPTNLRLHRAAAAVELGEGGLAVEIHKLIEPSALGRLPPERRAQHLLDLARAYLQVGDLSRAGAALLDSERISPAEIRQRPAAREAMSEVVRRTPGAPPASVTELAKRMGLPV